MERSRTQDLSSEPHATLRSFKRWAIKLFVLVVLLGISLDSLPPRYTLRGPAKHYLATGINLLGLYQGAWTMFAPNPMVNHLWLSADIYDEQGVQVETWNSPYWNNEGTWNKFIGFRHLNYYTRMCSPLHRTPARDLAAYLARTKQTDATGTLTVEVYANSLELASPVDGTMPAPDELVWVTESRQLNDPWSNVDLENFAPPPAITWGSEQ